MELWVIKIYHSEGGYQGRELIFDHCPTHEEIKIGVVLELASLKSFSISKIDIYWDYYENEWNVDCLTTDQQRVSFYLKFSILKIQETPPLEALLTHECGFVRDFAKRKLDG